MLWSGVQRDLSNSIEKTMATPNAAQLRFSRTLGALIECNSFQKIKKNHPDSLRKISGGGIFGWPASHAKDDTNLTRAILLA
jgi:hypothetical protein